jgi:L-fuconolactonase
MIFIQEKSMPTYERFDTYVHVWDVNEDTYPFDLAFGPPPDKALPLAEYRKYMDRFGVVRAALVQPGYYGFDASLIADAVKREPQRYVGLGMVDPTKPDVADKLSYWVKEKKLVGMRVNGPMLSAPYIADLWRRAAELNAVLSIGMFEGQDLYPLARMLETLPPAPVVVDHLGLRHITDKQNSQQLLDLARFPNVYLKWSAFYYLSKLPYPHPDAAWILQATLETFGAKRIMLAGDYAALTNLEEYGDHFEKLLGHFSFITAKDMAWICGKTAAALWPKPKA